MHEKTFDTQFLAALASAVPGGVERNVSLASRSRWRIGGPAAVMVQPSSPTEAAAVMSIMADRAEPLFIMGDASNVLFDDAGFDGVVMRIGNRMNQMRISGETAWAQAGVWVPHFARRVGCSGLSGIEHVIGIPGTLGGLVLMNGGSQRKGIGLNISHVLCADARGELFSFTGEQCHFAYRSSSLQQMRAVVLEAEFAFERRDPALVRREMIDIMVSRRSKFPKNLPNCGSTFLSDPAMYATVGPPGRAIEAAGLKGKVRGGAQISPLHANFIVTTGRASSDDVLWLVALIRKTVLRRTGYAMDCEVRHVSADGRVRRADEAAEERFAEADLREFLTA